MKKTIVAIPDLHFPFHDRKSLSIVFDKIKQIKPDIIIQLGDLFDFFSYSRFPRNPNIITPKDEISLGLQCAHEMWNYFNKILPRGKFIQLMGNHSPQRINKKVLEQCPEIIDLIQPALNNIYKFQNVETIYDYRSDIEIEGIVFEHGYLSKPGAHIRQNMKPTVFGHWHSAHIIYEHIRDQLLWEMCCGHLADTSHEALKYTPKKYVKWTQGFGLIENGIPRFVPITK